MPEVVCSDEMRRYFDSLEAKAKTCYAIANEARSKGYDPELQVEILEAEDLALRVEALLKDFGITDIAEEIRELSMSHNREEVSLMMAKRVAKRPWRSKEEALDRAVRVGLAILTEGILVAPLEGIVSVKVRNSREGSYAEVYYSGPIRSAGGTGQALSVLIADVVRRELGIGPYKAKREEVERYKEEIPLYKNVQHLQYLPSPDEIGLMVKNCPVGINGEGTENIEVTGFRDIPRLNTNRVRGGGCLVIAEGMCQKAAKIQGHVRRLGIDGWEFIAAYLKKKSKKEEVEVGPDARFMQDILAGRPVLSHPSRRGGFRLRYGRSRVSGLAAISLNPATMFVLDEFIAVGTQLKIERPGKAGAVTPCDSIEGPIVLLKNGNLVQINTVKDAKRLRKDIWSIIDIGEMLISYGEFIENNHMLMPSGFTLEWYEEELRRKAGELPENWQDPGPESAFEISERFDIPLHPSYNLFWNDLQAEEIRKLQNLVSEAGRWENDRLTLQKSEELKDALTGLGALHDEKKDTFVVDKRYSYPLLRCLGLAIEGKSIVSKIQAGEGDALDVVSKLSGVRVLARAPTRIGARMGRPEKAKERLLTPPPHVLFPVGREGGSQRLVGKSVSHSKIKADIGLRMCPTCRETTFLTKCQCGGHTVSMKKNAVRTIDMRKVYGNAVKILKRKRVPDVKGVRGMTSRLKVPEALEKGFLRAKHGIHVFKDGTSRFDMTDVPLTHFKPSEIGVRAEKIKALGYEKDVDGRKIENDEQLIELKPQDIIVSRSCGDFLLKVSRFIDDLAVNLYDLKPYYVAKNAKDLVGHLVIAMSPHTSGGVLGRLIGFTKANVMYAHPYFHAAKRRNCDGDEDCAMLLLDGLMNFSREFLPEKRGGLMDAPLVLTTRLDPNEIDKEAHNLDVSSSYPLEFYEACARHADPKEVEDEMDMVKKRIGTVLQFEGFGTSHRTSDLAMGPAQSSYKEGTMEKKLKAQIELAAKIRAVDTDDVVSKIISGHFLPDLMGNLRAFSSQQFRCSKCGDKYRRVPLKGRCLACGSKLQLTVYEKSVKKYLAITKRLSEEYRLSGYINQRIALMDEAINSLFVDKRGNGRKLEDFI
jgi:DNA polymerase II large subunit